MAAEVRDSDENVTVGTYRPSEYTQANWPVVNSPKEASEFVLTTFDRVSDATQEVDGMFADFGSAAKEAIELSREAGDFDLNPVIEVDVEHLSASPDLCEQQTQSAATDEDDIVGPKHVGDLELEDETAVAQLNMAKDNDASTGQIIQINEEQLKSALTESYERGCADTRLEVVSVQEQLEEHYRLLWEDMQSQLEEALKLNETRAVELALQLARRLVGDVVENQRDYILRTINEAMKVAAGAEVSAVRVSPRDYEFLKLADYGDPKKFISGQALNFISDESIRAGCVLVTSAGEVDYDLDSAWQRIRSKAQQESES
jgi:flagellar biosynthesis/type III secretory pathway protein FliH